MNTLKYIIRSELTESLRVLFNWWLSFCYANLVDIQHDLRVVMYMCFVELWWVLFTYKTHTIYIKVIEYVDSFVYILRYIKNGCYICKMSHHQLFIVCIVGCCNGYDPNLDQSNIAIIFWPLLISDVCF